MVSKKFEVEYINRSLYRISPKVHKRNKINTKIYKLWRLEYNKRRKIENEVRRLHILYENKVDRKTNTFFAIVFSIMSISFLILVFL